MRMLLRFARLVDAFTERLGDVATWLVLGTVIVGFYNPVVRYLGRFLGFNLASNLYLELQWYLYSLTFFVGFAYILKHGINVRVDFLYSNWSIRTRAWVDFLGTLLVLIPFCLLGMYVTWNPVLASWGRLPSGAWDFNAIEWSPDPNGLPRAPIKTMIIVAFGTLLIQAVAELIKRGAVLAGYVEPAAEAPPARRAEGDQGSRPNG